MADRPTPTPTIGATMSDAARDVLAERQRQISAEGWTPQHDDEHTNGSLALVGACYAWASTLGPTFRETLSALDTSGVGGWRQAVTFRRLWKWDFRWWKPKNCRDDLIRAAALLIAEIERIDRAEQRAVTK